MLRVVPDREVAKEAAHVNVSALVSGQPRIVPSDEGGDRDPDAESGGAAGETLGDDDSYGSFL